MRGHMYDAQSFVIDLSRPQYLTEKPYPSLHIRVTHNVMAVPIPANRLSHAIKCLAKGLKDILGVNIAATLYPDRHHIGRVF